MNLRKTILKIRCVTIFVALVAASMCLAASGCGTAPAGSAAVSSAASDAAQSTPASEVEEEANPVLDQAATARTETHYAMYYANRELKKLTYLDTEYAALNDTYDKAARAWYKGQYYMDLVSCGEVSQESEVQQYLDKAMDYFGKAKADANLVFESLTA